MHRSDAVGRVSAFMATGWSRVGAGEVVGVCVGIEEA